MECKCCICWNYMNLEQKICYICDYEYEYFLSKPNIVGVGLGYEVKNGFCTDNICIKVFVTKKISENELPVQYMVPKLYKGIKTDVVESGQPKALSLTKRTRPVLGGYGISAEKSDLIGTIGCMVTDGCYNYLLGNNHILTEGNELPVDDTLIIQPAQCYGGNPQKDAIANLSKFIPIKFKNFLWHPTNYVDCAIAKIVDKTVQPIVSPEIAFIGNIKAPVAPKLKTKVKKVGCITEYTRGTIISINITQLMNFDKGRTALFKKQIATTVMASPGDSGAIMIDDNNHAIGLLLGGTDNTTVYNDISYVLQALNVSIVTN